MVDRPKTPQEITDQRLDHWKQNLYKMRATPLILVSCGIVEGDPNFGKLIIQTTEERSDADIKLILSGVLNQL